MADVMIIDDDIAVCDKLREMLKAYGEFNLNLVAGTLEEARRMLLDNDPDLLFLDLELPDGNGMELLRFIREYRPGLYVVVFTGFYHNVNEEAYTHGEDDYLLKPVFPDELDKVVRRYNSTVGKENGGCLGAYRGKLFDTIALINVNNEQRIAKYAEIGFFRYDGKKKLWAATLDDATSLYLRKGTCASDIIKLSPFFQQTHQSFIVNLNYVKYIGKAAIRMHAPFKLYSIPVGRAFQAALSERLVRI